MSPALYHAIFMLKSNVDTSIELDTIMCANWLIDCLRSIMMSRIDSRHWKISTGRHFQNGQHNTAQIQHCPISTPFHMWVDYDVPNWFLTSKNYTGRHFQNGHHNTNRQTSGESASLPQYLGCNTVFDMCLRVTFFAGRPYHFNQTLRTANKF